MVKQDDGTYIFDEDLYLRYHAAAAAIVKSSAEFTEGSPEYEYYKKLEKLGESDPCQTERELLLDIRENGSTKIGWDKSLFSYGQEDIERDKFYYNLNTEEVSNWRRLFAVKDFLENSAISGAKSALNMSGEPTPSQAAKAFIGFFYVVLDNFTTSLNTAVTGRKTPTVRSIILEKQFGIKENPVDYHQKRLGLKNIPF